MMAVIEIYEGSDAEATKALYERLETIGPDGMIAMNLFRAQKASARAKVYRGGIRGRGSFKSMAYEKKGWSLEQLCAALAKAELAWGWKRDAAQTFHQWVLYVDLPTGQVSFHAGAPISENRYTGEWDGAHLSAERIIRFVEDLLAGRASVALLGEKVREGGSPSPAGESPALPRREHQPGLL